MLNKLELTKEERIVFNIALFSVKHLEDIPREIEKLKETILSLNKEAMKGFENFAKQRVKALIDLEIYEV